MPRPSQDLNAQHANLWVAALGSDEASILGQFCRACQIIWARNRPR